MVNLIEGTSGYGQKGLVLTEVRLRDGDGVDTLSCLCGQRLSIVITAEAREDVRRPNLGYAIYAPGGELLYSEGALNHGVVLADLLRGESCTVVYDIEMALAPGRYSLSVLAADNDTATSGDSGVHHDTRERIAEIEIGRSELSDRFDGLAWLPVQATSSVLAFEQGA